MNQEIAGEASIKKSQGQWTAVFHWKPFGFLHKVTINFKET